MRQAFELYARGDKRLDEIADFLFAHGIHTKKGMVCGMMFTNERQVKRQKNGNVYVYDYYRCTRKNKAVACKEPHIRAEELDKQLSALLLCYTMSASWADKLRELIDKDEKIAGRRCALPAKKPPVRATVSVLVAIWCARRESNPHGLFIQGILSPSRLPIPPLAHGVFIKMEAPTGIEPVYAVLQTAA